MQMKVYGKKRCSFRFLKKLFLVSYFFFFLNVSSFSQEISFSFKNANLEDVFRAIETKSAYRFVFTREELTETIPVTLDVHRGSILDILNRVFDSQPLSYTINKNYIIVHRKEKNYTPSPQHKSIDIQGLVLSENGAPIAGASVLINKSKIATATDENGRFLLKGVDEKASLLVSSIGYNSSEVLLQGKTFIEIHLSIAISALDETVVIAYGTTTRRLNTGSVSKLVGDEISKQPVTNPLAALSGRLPGLIVTQSSGLPGASYKLQIRGQNSIAQGNDPLIIIDGVPFAANNNNINQVGVAFAFGNNGLSPFGSINPFDIESIEILKDADATAIYGSRGANGVILITTKKGKAGKTKFDFNVYSGVSRITNSMPLLNTKEYINMRKEAFRNDGVVTTNSNAYDLLLWDTSRYTDLKKLLIGGTAHISDVQASVSGGSEQTQFLINGGYHKETTVYPGSMGDNRGSLLFDINHISTNKRFKLHLQGSNSFDKNTSTTQDLAKFINLPPNLPELYNANGDLNWSGGGFAFSNPLSFLRLSYVAKTDNLLGNLQLHYNLTKRLSVKTNFGYNVMQVSEISTRPIASQNPAFNPTGSSQFGNSIFRSVIIEPQLEYMVTLKRARLTLLGGASWQQNTSNLSFISASGYTNDALLQSISGGSNLYATTNYTQYRYAALFGRINYNLDNKYLINLTARRDGSSRFGPAKQYANFGAVGAGWIFTNEKYFQSKFKFLSYGKLRASFGITGNDGIGDYKYLDTYSNTSYPYQGLGGTYPTALFNADYGWEVNRKLGGAVELGFLKERLLVTIEYYRNRSDNQLVQYALPSQTGFTSVTKNLPALVQNNGWEIDFSAGVVKTRELNWVIAFTLTMPKNALLSFPDLLNSSYYNLYSIGAPLNTANGFAFGGVNSQTGVYQFSDYQKNMTSNPQYPRDYLKNLYSLDPVFYGGFRNSLTFKNLQIDFFFEFRKQTGYSYLRDVTQAPGVMRNQPLLVLNRWQKPGDITNIQKFTQSFNSAASIANNAIIYDGASNFYSDASYLRFKNLAISYRLPDPVTKKFHMLQCRFYIQGQNLATFTNYEGGDPETQRYFFLPPLKTLTAGIQLTF